MHGAFRTVAWFLSAVIALLLISIFLHFLLRVALLFILLAGGYYLYARARQMLNRR